MIPRRVPLWSIGGQRCLAHQQTQQQRAFSASAAAAQNSQRENHYSVLGVSVHSTQAEIKKAFYALSKQYHPDAAGERGDLAKYQRITAAWATLGSPSARRSYNATLGAAVRRPEGFYERPHGAHAHPHTGQAPRHAWQGTQRAAGGHRFHPRPAPGPRPADHAARSDPALDPLRPHHSHPHSHAQTQAHAAARRAPHFNAAEHLARQRRADVRREELRKQQMESETHESERDEWRGRTGRTGIVMAAVGVASAGAFYFFRR